MISSPVYYFRQYENDLPAFSCLGGKNPPQLFLKTKTKIENWTKASLPLLAACPILRIPLTIGLGTLRSIAHLEKVIHSIRQRDIKQLTIHSLHLVLSLAGLSLIITATVSTIFNPSLGLLLFAIDDVIANVATLIKAIRQKDKKLILASLAFLAMNSLYISALCFGHIEILAVCMLLQASYALYKSVDAFRRREFVEGILHVATSALAITQVVPQMKVIQWKWSKNPTLEGELCRDERGFVYVKVKDDIIYDLNKVFGSSGSIPPYFGKGRHGAHITVIKIDELPKDMPMPELGKTIKFNIAFKDTLRPEGFKGVKTVSFVALHAPQLDAIRAKYGLTPKINGNHDFHITYGIQYEN